MTPRNGENGLLYVYTHIDRGIKIVDPGYRGKACRPFIFTTQSLLHSLVDRTMLYDADGTSSNGESSCASCHVFGDTDHLSWNLGNPDREKFREPSTVPDIFPISFLNCDMFGHYPGCEFLPYINGNGDQLAFSSLKGPMFTQTLRGHVDARPHALARRSSHGILRYGRRTDS